MKRVICCILTSVFILLTGMGQTGISVKAETLSEEQDWYEKNVFIRSADSSNAEVTGMIFSTEFFTGDNQVLNQEIAKCSVGLAGAVYEFNYIDTILNDLGFSYDDYKEEAATRYGNWNRSHSAGDNDFVRYIIATKEFVHNGENYILYCVPIQGTNGSFDWTSNVNIGETDNHEGFYTAHEEIMDDLFVRMMNDGYEAGKRIVWVTGHSRGAAVANIVAGELTGGIDDMSSKIYSGLVQSDHVYGYTFACPNVSKDTRVKNSGYMNIYNFNNPDDIVPSVPLDDWGYGRYGQTIDLSSLTREIVDMRYQQEYERSYRGNDHFATILNEEIAPRLIGNSGDANDVYMKAFLNGFAYLMQKQHDFRGFLEAAGFFAKDNFWALIMKQIEKLNPFDSLISYLNKIGFLATRVAEYASATENMTEEEFAVWLEEHRTEVDEIESAFEYNIKSNFDLKSLYILVESDLFFEIQGIRLNATLTENLITILGDVFAYWVGMDGDLAVADIVADAHAPATYAYWINAMYFGYKGYYGYNKDRTITAAVAEDDQILTIGTSCFENASNVKSLVLRSQAKYIGNNACKSVSSLEKLVLPETLVHIGNYAFYNCSSASLENLQFAPGLKTIGNYSFYGCTGITGTLTIPDTVESIGIRAFNNDSGITEVIMPVSRISDGYEVTNINGYYDYYGAFTGCSGITKVKLTGSGDMPEVHKEDSSRFDDYYDKGTITPWGAAEYAGNAVTVELSEGITSISDNAFYKSTKLTNVNIPSTVKSIGAYAFYECTGMNGATLPEGLTELGTYAFYNCKSMEIKNLTIPSGIHTVNPYVFYDCIKITGTLTIPSTVENIGDYSFYGCTGITGTLIIPDTVASIGIRAFNNDSGITEVIMPVSRISDGYEVTNINGYYDYYGAFTGCSGITKVKLTGSGDMPEVHKEDSSRFDDYYDKGTITPWGAAEYAGNAVTVELPEGLTSISDYAFYKSTKLTNVNIPSTVQSIGHYAFYECTGMNGASLPEGLTELGAYAFYNCKSMEIENLTIPSGIHTVNPYVFYDCIKITGTLTIPDTVESIQIRAFNNDTGITEVIMPVSRISDGYYKDNSDISGKYCGPFTGCSGITKVKLTGSGAMPEVHTVTPNSYDYLDKGTITPWGAAEYAGNAVTVELPEGLTSISDYAFYNSTKLTNVNIPSTVQSIGQYAFYECTGMNGASLPERLTELGAYAFYNCKSMEIENLKIPSGIKAVNLYVFYNCSNITGPLTIPSTVESIGDYSFYGCTGIIGTLTIPDTVASIGIRAFNNDSGITEVIMPVSRISDGYYKDYSDISGKYCGPFTGCSGITKVKLTGSGDMPKVHTVTPNSYDYLDKGTITPWGAAEYAGNAVTVELSEGITSISDNAFYNSTKLTNVNIPSTVQSIGQYAFYECTGMNGASLPERLTELGAYAFYNCKSMEIENLTIPSGIKAINQYVFYNCSKITGTLTIPDTVESIQIRAFNNDTGITEVIMPVSRISDGYYKDNSNIGGKYYGPFTGCGGITKVKLTGSGAMPEVHTVTPNSYDYLDKGTITPWGAAEYAGNAVTVELPEGLTSISDYAFYNCTKLTQIRIPKTVQSIGNSAFNGNGRLTSVIYNSCICDWEAIAKGTNNTSLTNNNLIIEWETELDSWIWPDDDSPVKAVFLCHKDGEQDHRHEIEAEITDQFVIPATCTEDGQNSRTAVVVLAGKEYRDTCVTNIPALSHMYGEPTYEWAEDNSSVTAKAVCEHDTSHVVTETVNTTVTTIEATCEEAGSTTYTAKFTNEHFTEQTKVIEIPALGHKYGEPTYEWSEDNSSVTAKAVCEHDSAHVVTETVIPTAVTNDATCEEAGRTTYTAAFTNELFTEKTKDVEIPALGHDWSEWMIVREATEEEPGLKTRTCHRCGHEEELEIPQLDHVHELRKVEAVEPLCETEGNIEYYICDKCGHMYLDELAEIEVTVKEVVLATLGHKYGEPVYEWSADYSSVTAKAICEHDADHVITETVQTTVKTVDATCEEAGSTTYTAKFTNEHFNEQTKVIEIPALGHKYGEPTYEWAKDNSSVTAKAICEHDTSHVVTETINTTVTTVEATCEEAGSTTYTAAFTNELFSEQTKVVEIPALGHKYGEPTYEWSEDNSSVNAKAICEHDANHVIAETVETTSETIPATEDKDGSTTYTAVFTNTLFTTQTKVIVIPATGPQMIHVTGVELNKEALTLRVGKSETLIATVLPEDAEDKSVTWSSSDPSVAKVDANGKVTAVADTGIADPASAVITVTTNDGKYTASCTVTVEDPVNAFVRRLYDLCFGRKADSGGFNMWTSGLRTKKYTAAFVVQAFFTSNEMKNMKLPNEEWVERCYLVMMNRASDAGGKKGWVNKLDIGMSQTYVLRGFVGSTEFNNVCKDYGVERGSVTISEPRDQNQGITEFVSRCYSEVLGRGADPGGLNNWCKKILTASNRKQAAIDAASNGFFHSPEYLNKHTNNDQYVRTLYRTFLGREADQGGYNNWMKALNGGTSRDDVMKGFANSAEFAKIMAKYGIK